MVGTQLGRYRILEPLGAGGMGRVYLAEDPSLGRRVAIKVLPPDLARDSGYRARLLAEAQSASGLNHPNILTVYDLGEHGETLYVAMELIDGVILRHWAGERRRTPAEIFALVRQATRALAVAHAQGLVHRDLKPENIMVRRDGLLKILDFGLARSVSPQLDQATMLRTAPGTLLGTAPYMSPEQVLGQPAGPASDVFSIGTLLHELLTGRHPFSAATPVETMHRILHEPPDPPSKVVAGLPPAVDFVLAKALARDPARRYATAQDLDVDLEACEATLAPAAPAAPAVPAHEAGATTAKAPRAIAVLPFKHIGGGADLDYLGIGLADALITRLSTSPDLVVRATSSIARYEKTPVDPRHVAQELEVNAVLDASYQRAGSRFRARARLIEEPGGRALWADTIDVEFDDIFAVEEEVATAIAQAMSARLRAASGGRHTPAPEVFELYLRSREPDRTGTRAGMLHKIDLLERALARDPEYADAWAYLSKLQHSMVDAGFDADEAWYVRADESCRRALEIDPDHSYAHYSLGALHLVRGRKREAYRAFVKRHLEHPNDFQPLHYLGYLFRLCNLTQQSLAVETLGTERDPSTPWPVWARIRLLSDLGRHEEAQVLHEAAQPRFGSLPLFPVLGLMLLRNRGLYAEVVEQAASMDPGIDEGRQLFERAHALVRLGRADEARPHIEGFERFARSDMDFAAQQAIVRAQVGEHDAAFALLERAAELGNDGVYFYEREDLFGPLHGDARWPVFLARARERAESYRDELRWPIEGSSRTA